MTPQRRAEKATTNIKIRIQSRGALNRKKAELRRLLKRSFVSQSDAIDWLVLFHDMNNSPTTQ